METVVERPGALDVHKAQVTACVRTPGPDGRREQHVEEFPTTVAGLLTLRDWLAAHGVTQVTMEATGVYWKPVWAILEDEFELLLVNARHVKQGPGRKTDISDAAWLCQLAEAQGELRAAQADPHAAQPDALSQDADPGARAGGQPAARGARGHRHQARLRRPPTSSASRGARCSTRSSTAPPIRRCWPSSPAAAWAPNCPRCAKRWRAASIGCTRCGSGRSSRTSTSSTSRSPT